MTTPVKQRVVAEQGTVPSPCIRACCLNDDDVCLGCFRHIDEILVWGSADNTRKKDILKAAGTRKKASGYRAF